MSPPIALAASPPQKNVGAAARSMGSSQIRGCLLPGANPWVAHVAGDPLSLQIVDCGGPRITLLRKAGVFLLPDDLPRTAPDDAALVKSSEVELERDALGQLVRETQRLYHGVGALAPINCPWTPAANRDKIAPLASIRCRQRPAGTGPCITRACSSDG